MKFILGKKMNMTQLWVNDKVFAVTPIKAGPCVISQIKTKDSDGYSALQLAFGQRKEKNIKKPQLGHFKKSGTKPAHVKEFIINETDSFKVGDTINVETFAVGDIVNISGVSKGKGFQGVVKRHGFAGFRKTHGNKDQERMGGSIGPKGPAHVFKGTKMGGRMGAEKVTVTNLEIVTIDEKEGIIFIKGATPGAINSLTIIKGQGELKVNLKKEESVEKVESEEVKVEAEEKKEEVKVETEEKKEEVKVETEEKKEEVKTENKN